MKLQEQGLISLDVIEQRIKHLAERHINSDNEEYKERLFFQLQELNFIKKSLTSPIPLAEKIWDESKGSWEKEKMNYSSSEIWFKEHKQTFLNSDIKID